MTLIAADWIDDRRTRTVMHVLVNAGFQAWFVGGCVRDAMLDRPVTDVDIATDARPDQVLRLANDAGVRAIPTGADHGTITIVVDGLAHEVTTFRRDVETDGRRAVVAFSDDIAEDAQRRDLTINALYADHIGNVTDPTGHGLDDLQTGRVRFIGDADARIKEDYLRILRFFRFHAIYADQSEGFDQNGLVASAANLAGLETLSTDRIGAEMRKMLMAPDPAPALSAMMLCGVLPAILPGADAKAIAPLVHAESGLPPEPIRRMAALGGEQVELHLRLSRAETKTLTLLRAHIGNMMGAKELGYRLGADRARDVLLLRAALLEQPLQADIETEITKGAQAKFPISAQDLMPDLSGVALGNALKQLESDWVASGFTLDRELLLSGLK